MAVYDVDGVGVWEEGEEEEDGNRVDGVVCCHGEDVWGG